MRAREQQASIRRNRQTCYLVSAERMEDLSEDGDPKCFMFALAATRGNSAEDGHQDAAGCFCRSHCLPSLPKPLWCLRKESLLIPGGNIYLLSSLSRSVLWQLVLPSGHQWDTNTLTCTGGDRGGGGATDSPLP